LLINSQFNLLTCFYHNTVNQVKQALDLDNMKHFDLVGIHKFVI